ncbi:glycosyl hydrolase family 8 [Paenibacillus sp. UNC451MF]|uniref:glycosyl hydrolase family 8 n=1 Tax=Paenibacillus sp. UNC451MF TaxID=1449063 RepID=UPI00068DE005|nr:glycosyl hydrolase family 8 [Paenibacillus sp. UNC451MF]
MALLKKSIWSMSVIVAAIAAYMLLPIDNKYKAVTDVNSQSNEAAVERVRLLPGEQFIQSHMINENGTLRTYLLPKESKDPQTAAGHDALSESMGFWLQYALEKGDPALFRQNAEIVKTSFMKPDGWIAWKVGPTNTSATTNALVDDLRIAYSLYSAGAKWQDAEFKKTADSITKSVVSKQVVNGTFRDFYDMDKKWPSNVITLSYLDATALTSLYEQSKISEGLYQKTKTFMIDLPLQNGFYPFNYHVDEERFEFHDQVNLLDQLFVEYSRAKFGQKDSEFWAFLKEAFQNDHVLYGKYDIASKQRAVEYESPSVYGLAILCALEHNDSELAKDLYYRMIRFQTLNPASEYYGGYIDYRQTDTHIFDNLVPLLAERKLYNARILQ